jgi:hypothetical protein
VSLRVQFTDEEHEDVAAREDVRRAILEDLAPASRIQRDPAAEGTPLA